MEKKEIGINFVGWHEGFRSTDLQLFDNDIISKEFKLVVSDDPDFVFYGPYGKLSDLLMYENSVKILVSSYEPVSADFLFFDYCIGYEPFEYGDRYCFFPMFIMQILSGDICVDNIKTKDDALKALYEKTRFCDFIYKHETHENKRSHYFELLNKYKKVDSAGTFMNNQPDKKSVHYYFDNNSKFEFQRTCKFSLCIQTIKLEWFINEKIVHSIANNQIPIFYGTDKISKFFNKKRFINVDDFKTDDELLNYIAEIDSNDDLFMKIILEPTFNDPRFVEKVSFKAFIFLRNIFRNGRKFRRNELYAMEKYYNQIKSYEAAYRKMLTLSKFYPPNWFRK